MKKEIQEIQKLLTKLSGDKTQDLELNLAPPPIPFDVGKSYLIRTVTMYYTGRVVAITGKFIQLEEAAWIADAGRWEKATKEGSFDEVEPIGFDPWINTDSIVDFGEITYKLPNKQI